MVPPRTGNGTHGNVHAWLSLVVVSPGDELVGSILALFELLFSTWGLTDKGAFQGATVFSFLLALLTQGVSAIRAVVMKHVIRRRKRKVMLLFLYVLQSFMGYMIMLIAMTYSWELLLSVVFGVMMGNRLFVKGDEYELKQQQTMRREGDVATTMQEPLLAATNE